MNLMIVLEFRPKEKIRQLLFYRENHCPLLTFSCFVANIELKPLLGSKASKDKRTATGWWAFFFMPVI